jgi:hypothetical protein
MRTERRACPEIKSPPAAVPAGPTISQVRQLSFDQLDAYLGPANAEPVAKLTPGDATYRTARVLLTDIGAVLPTEPDVARIRPEVAASFPGATKNEILWRAVALVRLTARQEYLETRFQGQELHLTRTLALVEATLIANKFRIDRNRLQTMPLASPDEVKDREIDVNFARALAMRLKSEVMSGGVSSRIDQLAAGGTPRNVARALVIEQTIRDSMAGRECNDAGDSAAMNPDDLEFAQRFCDEMSASLQYGCEFTERVNHHLQQTGLQGRQESRDQARMGCAIGVAREILVRQDASVESALWKRR